jgi:hypothetical protein
LASRSYNFLPTVFWSLLLVFGVLILLNLGPSQAPPLAELTAYRCDPLPISPEGRPRNTGARPLTCRSGTEVIHPRGIPPIGSNGAGWSACVQAGGVITLWRHPLPSPYGARIFQTACGEKIYFSHRAAAEGYATARATLFLVGAGAIGLALGALALKLIARRLTSVEEREVALRNRRPSSRNGRRR